MSVTLYRVRRPDGTIIDRTPSSDKALAAAGAWDELPREMRVKAQLAAEKGAVGPRLLWTLADLGYTIEAVEYAEVQPRPKLEKVREALALLIWKIDNGEQNRSIGHYAGMLTHALSELDAVEGRGES